MKHAALAIASITSLLTSVTAFGQSSPSNARPAIDVVPIYLSDLRALAMLRIGNHPPAPVVFDTGTSGNDIDSDYADAVNLEFDPSVHVRVGDGTGKTFEAKEAKIPVATLGEVPLAEKTATVFPYKERDVVGIFGPGSFTGRQVLIDFGHGRLIVRDRGASSSCAKSAPYTQSGLPQLMIQVAGLSLPAMMDSGSNNPLVFSKRMAGKIPLRGPLRLIGKGRKVTGDVDIYEGDVAGDIRIGHIVLHDPTVEFTEKDVPNIGLPLIRQLVVMLDPERQRACIVDPPSLSAGQLAGYAGRYGERTIRSERGALVYQRDGRKPYALRPLTKDLFANDKTGDIVQFWRENGRVVRMDFINNIGVPTSMERSTATPVTWR